MLQTAEAAPEEVARPSVATSGRKLSEARPSSVTIIHRVDRDVPLLEATSADARAARGGQDPRCAAAAAGPAVRAVGTTGKVSLTSPRHGLAARSQHISLTSGGAARSATVRSRGLRRDAEEDPVKRQSHATRAVGAEEGGATPWPRSAPPRHAFDRVVEGEGAKWVASAWVRSLTLGDNVCARDYRGEWHEGRVVELQRFQVRAARPQPLLPSSHVCVCLFCSRRARREMPVAYACASRALQVKIHFIGWNSRHDEWVERTSKRLRAPKRPE